MSNLPIHPQLAALNLPPMPWSHSQVFTTDRSVWDSEGFELAWMDSQPDHKTEPELGFRQQRQIEATANVLATAPDVINAALWLKESLVSPNSTPANSRQCFEDLMTAIARALGTTLCPQYLRCKAF